MTRHPASIVRRAALLTAVGGTWWLACAGTALAAVETDRQYCERQEGIAKTVCLRELDKAEKAPSASTAKPPPGAAATAAQSARMPSAVPPATAGAKPGNASAAAAPDGPSPYKVVDGFHVDPQTFKGFQTWRAGACDRCHGANQEGLVGPSLITSLKTLTKSDFVATVTNGRLEKGMPSFSTNQTVVGNLDSLYAYLKGRSDGAITKAHVEKMP